MSCHAARTQPIPSSSPSSSLPSETRCFEAQTRQHSILRLPSTLHAIHIISGPSGANDDDALVASTHGSGSKSGLTHVVSSPARGHAPESERDGCHALAVLQLVLFNHGTVLSPPCSAEPRGRSLLGWGTLLLTRRCGLGMARDPVLSPCSYLGTYNGGYDEGREEGWGPRHGEPSGWMKGVTQATDDGVGTCLRHTSQAGTAKAPSSGPRRDRSRRTGQSRVRWSAGVAGKVTSSSCHLEGHTGNTYAVTHTLQTLIFNQAREIFIQNKQKKRKRFTPST